MLELEKLLERKVEIELNNYCKNHLDCSKCKELCAEVKEYNEINKIKAAIDLVNGFKNEEEKVLVKK